MLYEDKKVLTKKKAISQRCQVENEGRYAQWREKKRGRKIKKEENTILSSSHTSNPHHNLPIPRFICCVYVYVL